MKKRWLSSIFLALGIGSGFISNYVAFPFSIIIPLIVLFLASVAQLKTRIRKQKTVLAENWITFILVWLVIWIFLFNL